MSSPTVEYISHCFVKPKSKPEESNQPYFLSHWDLLLISCHYYQKGLLFAKPKQEYSFSNILESLRESLELTLVHFYPLAGQLATNVDKDKHQCSIYVDCNKGPGALFIHANVDMSISDILSPTCVPTVVRSFFAKGKEEVNHDGHKKPLLRVQVTELVDGIFIGCSMNHALVDGASFWHFWNVWSEIHRANGEPISISRLPVLKRRTADGHDPTDLSLPFIQPEEFIFRYDFPEIEERFFHFSSETLAKLEAEANKEVSDIISKVSSFEALVAFVWRSIIRTYYMLRDDEVTHCKFLADNRTRIDPPLPEEYFGNSSVSTLVSTTTVGELGKNSLGWVASLLHQSVANHTEKAVRDLDRCCEKSPFIYQFARAMDATSDRTVQVASSPRFDIYGNVFSELGKPLAVRSGLANKFPGKVIVYPGCEGDGSVDLEICLLADSMSELVESDKEFMAAVSCQFKTS